MVDYLGCKPFASAEQPTLREANERIFYLANNLGKTHAGNFRAPASSHLRLGLWDGLSLSSSRSPPLVRPVLPQHRQVQTYEDGHVWVWLLGCDQELQRPTLKKKQNLSQRQRRRRQ